MSNTQNFKREDVKSSDLKSSTNIQEVGEEILSKDFHGISIYIDGILLKGAELASKICQINNEFQFQANWKRIYDKMANEDSEHLEDSEKAKEFFKNIQKKKPE